MEEIREFYNENKLKFIGFQDDKGKQGLWRYYSENGSLHKEIMFKDGARHGTFKRFFGNGLLAIETNFVNDRNEGIWKEYYYDGSIKEEGIYENGNYIILNFWDERGQQTLIDGTGIKTESLGASNKLLIAQFYENGKFVKEEKMSSVSYGQFIPNKP